MRVDCGPRGEWLVVLTGAAGPTKRVTCKSFDEARRTARHIAQRSSPCALVVCNAYHRVIDSSLVTTGDDQEGAAFG